MGRSIRAKTQSGRGSEQPPDQTPWFGSATSISIAIFVVACLAYLPALDLGWIWDDDDYVLENPLLRSIAGLGSIWLEPGKSPQYYPVVFTTLWAQFQLVGIAPTLYHATNVLLHAGNAVICYHVLRRMSLRGAALAALIFALHPIQVESVAWVTELKNLLSATCYGLTWLLLWPLLTAEVPDEGDSREGTARPVAAARTRWQSYLAAYGVFLLALLSKSVTASLPAALLVAIWFRSGRIRITQVVPLLPMFVLGAALGWNTARLERIQVGATGDEWSYSMIDRFGIAARSIVHYSQQAIAPLEQIFFYPRFETSIATTANWACLVLCGIVAAVGFYLAAKGKRGLCAACAFFVGSALPSLGFLNVYPHRFSFVADHFVYIPIIGLMCLVAWLLSGISQWLQTRGWNRLMAVLPAIVFLLFLALKTLWHIPVFSSQITLWEDTLAKNPTSVAAMQNLGLAYVDADRPEDAVQVLKQAVDYEFDRYQSFNSLGLALGLVGQREEAIAAFKESVALKSDYVRPWINLGNMTRVGAMQAEDEQRRQELRAEASTYYQTAWDISPNYLAAFALGTQAYESQDLDGAIQWFRAAVDVQPQDIDARFNLFECLRANGDQAAAIEVAESLLQDLPNNAVLRAAVAASKPK